MPPSNRESVDQSEDAHDKQTGIKARLFSAFDHPVSWREMIWIIAAVGSVLYLASNWVHLSSLRVVALGQYPVMEHLAPCVDDKLCQNLEWLSKQDLPDQLKPRPIGLDLPNGQRVNLELFATQLIDQVGVLQNQILRLEHRFTEIDSEFRALWSFACPAPQSSPASAPMQSLGCYGIYLIQKTPFENDEFIKKLVGELDKAPWHLQLPFRGSAPFTRRCASANVQSETREEIWATDRINDVMVTIGPNLECPQICAALRAVTASQHPMADLEKVPIILDSGGQIASNSMLVLGVPRIDGLDYSRSVGRVIEACDRRGNCLADIPLLPGEDTLPGIQSDQCQDHGGVLVLDAAEPNVDSPPSI